MLTSLHGWLQSCKAFLVFVFYILYLYFVFCIWSHSQDDALFPTHLNQLIWSCGRTMLAHVTDLHLHSHFIWACICTHICACICTYICACICIFIWANICTCFWCLCNVLVTDCTWLLHIHVVRFYSMHIYLHVGLKCIAVQNSEVENSSGNTVCILHSYLHTFFTCICTCIVQNAEVENSLGALPSGTSHSLGMSLLPPPPPLLCTALHNSAL